MVLDAVEDSTVNAGAKSGGDVDGSGKTKKTANLIDFKSKLESRSMYEIAAEM